MSIMLFCGLILIASIDTTHIGIYESQSEILHCFSESMFLLFFPPILNGLDFGKQNKYLSIWVFF